MSPLPVVISKRLSLSAYEHSQHGTRTRIARSKGEDLAQRKAAAAASAQANKELKASVLRRLQGQSNAGMVKIKDVATAIDHMLKR